MGIEVNGTVELEMDWKGKGKVNVDVKVKVEVDFSQDPYSVPRCPFGMRAFV